MITDPKQVDELPDGVYDGVENEAIHPAAYHGSRARMSQGRLRRILVSPLRFKAHEDGAEGPEETVALAAGNALHAAVLEPERFDDEYALEPDFGPKNKNPGKRLAAEWLADVPEGVTVIPKAAAAQTINCARAVLSNERVRRILFGKDGVSEVTVLWTESVELEDGTRTEVKMRGRIDRLQYESAGPMVWDLKKTVDSSPEGFDRSVLSFGLHFQAAAYTRGMTIASGMEHSRFGWIAFEAEGRCAGGIYRIDQESLEIGRMEYERALELLATARQHDEYPDHTDRVRECGLPEWYRKRYR